MFGRLSFGAFAVLLVLAVPLMSSDQDKNWQGINRFPGEGSVLLLRDDQASREDFFLEFTFTSKNDGIKLVGSYDTPGIAYEVAQADKYIFVADKSSGLQIIDVSDPTSPSLVGSYDTQCTADDVALAGGYAYVADECGLQIIDISNPASPSLVGGCDTPGIANAVAVAGNYTYVC